MKDINEHIDELFRNTIDGLSEEDWDIDKDFIWSKVVEKRHQSPKIVAFNWAYYLRIACLAGLVLFLCVSQVNQSHHKFIRITSTHVPKSNHQKNSIQEHKHEAFLTKSTPIKRIILAKNTELTTLKPLATKPLEVAFNRPTINPIKIEATTTKVAKLRLIHNDEFITQPVELPHKPALFYVQFNQKTTESQPFLNMYFLIQSNNQ